MLKRFHIVIGLFGLFAAPALAQPNAQPAPDAFGKEGADCIKLLTTDFSTTEDAPAQITSAKPVAAANNRPATCEVEGYVWRNVKFKVQLPLTGWNGKMLVTGSGGQAGSITTEQDAATLNPGGVLSRGYAYVGHDSGHASSGGDSKWGWNNESAMIDYGFRGGHVAGIIGKAIVRQFFGRASTRAYYHSCSNGGREALMMTQRYPWDYDGIIAGAPSLAYGQLFVNLYWYMDLLKDRSRSGFDMIAAGVLHKSVIAQCDRIDGLADGILDDPRLCKVDFNRVLCKQGAADDCLTQHQADIARRIYEGPRNPDGSQIAESSAMPGSELNWTAGSGLANYPTEVLRYLAFSPAPGPSWTPDPAKLGDYLKRMGLMESLFSATNPDLRKFKNRGGKLLSYYGWNDAIGGVRPNIDYYEAVERTMGGREKTQDFYRFFMIPGMNHCAGGDGASVFDYLGELDKWVETGKGPEVLTGYHPNPDGSPKFTRSIKPYRSQVNR